MKNAKMICGAIFQPPQLPACVLPDVELRALSEHTPFSEGEPLLMAWDFGEPVGGFWSLAEEVAQAMADEEVQPEYEKLVCWQSRVIFVLRAFYLLGVLRGGEAYRNRILGDILEPEFEDIPFALDTDFAEEFADDLRPLPMELLEKLLAQLGLDGRKEGTGCSV